MTNELILSALDGSNPLAYLAALGTLRLLTLEDLDVRMSWMRQEAFWRPVLHSADLSREKLCNLLEHSYRWVPAADFISVVGKNIKVSPEEFRRLAERAYKEAAVADRRAADFAAAFGCEACDDGKGNIEYTDFCFITGGGHQDFVGTMDLLKANVTRDHLFDALFGEWKLDRSLSMRWDPGDAKEYALQWGKPSSEGAWAVWGANRLAIEALPLFPTSPVAGGLATTGFNQRQLQDELTWPIWEPPLGLDSIRSLLSLAELQKEKPDRATLALMDIRDALSAQRVRIGQGANFKVSFRSARSV